MTEHDIVLTDDQRDVVELPWDAKALVTAGAGTGKSTVLVHRIEHLIAEEGLEAADILVLSFSRAAVRELSERLQRVGWAARRVRVQTFDSWASSVLYEQRPDRDDLDGCGFDPRIEMAARAVEKGVVEDSERGTPRHVVVDEVQDLVGVRRELVETVLDQFVHAGFTVVGDVAQSIYGFQISDRVARAGEVARFLDWVRTFFADELVERSLDRNFRTQTPQARLALEAGPKLHDMRTDEEATVLHGDLLGLLSATPSFGSLDEAFARDSLRDFDGTTGILCEDNGQVQWLSGKLDEHEIQHRVRRPSRHRPAPAWLAELLRIVPNGRIAEGRFDAVVAVFGPAVACPPVWAWRSLRKVAGAPRNQLDLAVLRRAITDERLPDDLTAPPDHRLTLSTIHRAKGTEFDRVVLVQPDALTGKADFDAQAEARLLYVAMTRHRHDLYRMPRPATWALRKGSNLPWRTERWYRSGPKRWMRTGLEVIEFDVDRTRPFDGGGLGSSVAASQLYMRDRVRDGDRIELRKLHDLPMSVDQSPEYGVFHAGNRIGDASERFRRDLWCVLMTRRTGRIDNWPAALTGVRVDGVETVCGTTVAGLPGGVTSVAWLVPRLCGLGRLVWSNSDGVLEGGSSR